MMVFTGAPAVLPMVKAGKLRAIGVSSAQRLDDIPTLAESGVKGLAGFEADQWRLFKSSTSS